jgi:hypothetical protein
MISRRGSLVVLAIAVSQACAASDPTQSPTGPETNDTTTNNPPPPASLANECQSPQAGWIWCDDFEQNRLSSYFEYDNSGGGFSRQAGVGVSSSMGMRAQFSQGQVGAGSLHLAMGRTPQSYFAAVDAGTTDYRELYWRVFLRHEPGWQGGGGDKLSRAFIFASPNTWAQAMIAHVWSGSPGKENFLSIDPASGTDTSGNVVTTAYNDFPNLRWLGLRYSTTPIFDAAHVGEWYCIEARVRLNDAGQSNGVFQVWIDGQLEIENTGMNWVGSYSDYGINAVYLENYWNDGSPVSQERYMDNFVVSTQPVGCG